jgi:hypothetical protein
MAVRKTKRNACGGKTDQISKLQFVVHSAQKNETKLYVNRHITEITAPLFHTMYQIK